MKKDLVEMVFILDRSGSMSGLEKDTIGGYNSMIEKQKKLEGEAIVSTILFDDQFELLHNRVALQDVKPITSNDYFVRGSTALLDAIGRSVHNIMKIHQELNFDLKPEKTIFVITTDGMENSSKEFSYSQIKEMIEKQKAKQGWEFIFFGANMDAVAVASSLGVDKHRASNYKATKEGTAMQYQTIHDVVANIRLDKDKSKDKELSVKKDINSKNKH